MNTTETEKLRYRLDKDTYESIEYTLVPESDRWDSLGDFTRKSIQNEAEPLTSVAFGGRQANRLIRLLSDIRGIHEDEQEIPVKPKIEGRNLDKSTSVTITVNDFNLVKKLADEMAGKPATATGYCIFKKLSTIAMQADHFDSARERRIIQTWTELRNSLTEPQLHLHHVLTRRFRVQQTSEYYFEHDPQPFEEFAEVYRGSFYQSDSYEFLEDTFGRRTLNDVENTIEEHTSLTFPRDDPGNDSSIKIFEDELEHQ